MTLAEYLAEMGAPEPVDPRARNTQAPPGATGVRDALLNSVTTEGSPAEWLAQKVAPGFKSTNTAGIYAKEPDVASMAMGMAGPMKIGESPAFDRWFGGSKVADAEGNPLTVYHGTAANFDAFKPSPYDIGMHFGSTPAGANERLADIIGDRPGLVGVSTGAPISPTRQTTQVAQGGSVMPAHLSLKNPIGMGDPGNWHWSAIRKELVDKGIVSQAEADAVDNMGPPRNLRTEADLAVRTQAGRDLLLSKGYDGFKYTNAVEDPGSVSYIALRPEQIKSAIGNRGTFDPSNPNITHALPPLVGAAGLAQFLRGKREDE